MFKIEQLPELPSEVIPGSAKYPFKELTSVGKSFIVPANQNIKSVANSARQFALRHGINIIARRQADGSLLVYRAEDRKQVAEASFINYLSSMTVNQAFTLKDDYAHQFLQLKRWAASFAKVNDIAFEIQQDEESLTIRRTS